ncbi:unnamed protein product, partial [Discosporangium mesarthrocarpum]
MGYVPCSQKAPCVQVQGGCHSGWPGGGSPWALHWDTSCSFMWHRLRILPILQLYMNDEKSDSYCLYGDPAYGSFANLNISMDICHEGVQQHMSIGRVPVEWVFKEMTSNFAFLPRKHHQTAMLSRAQPGSSPVPCSNATHVSALCVRQRNKVSSFFGMVPPTLSE